MTVELVQRVRDCPVDVEAYLSRVSRILERLEIRGRSLSLAFVDDEEMRGLNHTWRGRDRTTDVLSFAQELPPGADLEGDAKPPRGDVIISVERARLQAEARDASLGGVGYGLLDELTFLTLHGVLHLLGHDHVSEEEAEEMEALETRIFGEFSEHPPRSPHQEGAE